LGARFALTLTVPPTDLHQLEHLGIGGMDTTLIRRVVDEGFCYSGARLDQVVAG
jgi:hypothetical protein